VYRGRGRPSRRPEATVGVRAGVTILVAEGRRAGAEAKPNVTEGRCPGETRLEAALLDPRVRRLASATRAAEKFFSDDWLRQARSGELRSAVAPLGPAPPGVWWRSEAAESRSVSGLIAELRTRHAWRLILTGLQDLFNLQPQRGHCPGLRHPGVVNYPTADNQEWPIGAMSKNLKLLSCFPLGQNRHAGNSAADSRLPGK
jgi:hypothetical protein